MKLFKNIRSWLILRVDKKEVDCNDFKKGGQRNNALCEGTGHYLCRECMWLNRQETEMEF